jgi:3-hydroxybutyryl-CoA dehydratase
MDVEIGQKATRTLAVSAEMVEAFAGITGDYNPLHFDEAFAAGTRFGRLVAQGGIGRGACSQNRSGAFLTRSTSAVITATGTVTAAYPRRSMAKMEFRVESQDGVEVLRGEATVFQKQPEG